MSHEEVTPEYFHDMPHRRQREILEAWFRSNYEDPAHRTPYETAEGGYQWVWGGPFDAREELEGNFGGLASPEVIEELARELTHECWEWGPAERPEDYDVDFVDDISSNRDVYGTFRVSIDEIEQLSRAETPSGLGDLYYRMLFAQVITALETYLSDTFVSRVLFDRDLLRKYLETTPEFREQKIRLSEVLATTERVENIVKKTTI